MEFTFGRVFLNEHLHVRQDDSELIERSHNLNFARDVHILTVKHGHPLHRIKNSISLSDQYNSGITLGITVTALNAPSNKEKEGYRPISLVTCIRSIFFLVGPFVARFHLVVFNPIYKRGRRARARSFLLPDLNIYPRAEKSGGTQEQPREN